MDQEATSSTALEESELSLCPQCGGIQNAEQADWNDALLETLKARGLICAHCQGVRKCQCPIAEIQRNEAKQDRFEDAKVEIVASTPMLSRQIKLIKKRKAAKKEEHQAPKAEKVDQAEPTTETIAQPPLERPERLPGIPSQKPDRLPGIPSQKPKMPLLADRSPLSNQKQEIHTTGYQVGVWGACWRSQ